MFSTRPAAKLLIPFAAGILAGWEWEMPAAVLWSAAAILFATAIALSFADRELFRSSVLLLLWFFLGALKISLDSRALPADSVSGFTSIRGPVRLRGSLSSLPRKRGSSLTLAVEAETLSAAGRSVAVTGGVQATVDEAAEGSGLLRHLSYGDEITASGTLSEPSGARNPGERDMRLSLSLAGIEARFYAGEGDTVGVVPGRSYGFFSSLVAPVRRSAAGKLDTLIGGEESAFLKGLVVRMAVSNSIIHHAGILQKNESRAWQKRVERHQERIKMLDDE